MVFKKTYKKEDLKTLLIHAQKGDKNRYRCFLERIMPLIQSYLNKRLNNLEDVQDITQIALTAIHTSLHTYDPSQDPENWLYGITKYKWLDHLRSHYKKQEYTSVQEDYIETFVADDTNNIIGIHHDLEKIMMTLSDKQKELITLLKIKGYSVQEVAKKLKMSESNVKTTAHRAMKQLEETAKKHG